jgi:hypothetical protein
VVISSTISIQTLDNIITVQNKFQMLCINKKKLEKFSINTQLQWENQSLQILPGWNTGACSRPLFFLTISVMLTEKSHVIFSG